MIRLRLAELQQWHAAGLTQAEMARRIGCSRQRIGQVLRGHEPKRAPRPPRTAAFVSTARALWDEGVSAGAIAKRLGVTKNVIVGIAYNHGFPKRPSPIRRAA